MKKYIKIIDILCLASCDEILPKKIKYEGVIYTLHESDHTYYDEHLNCLWDNRCFLILNDEVETIDETTEYHLNTKDGNFTFEKTRKGEE